MLIPIFMKPMFSSIDQFIMMSVEYILIHSDNNNQLRKVFQVP